jgi:hypothetical protein
MKTSLIPLCTLAGASPLASAHGAAGDHHSLFHLFTGSDHVTTIALLAIVGILALTRPAMKAIRQKKH